MTIQDFFYFILALNNFIFAGAHDAEMHESGDIDGLSKPMLCNLLQVVEYFTTTPGPIVL